MTFKWTVIIGLKQGKQELQYLNAESLKGRSHRRDFAVQQQDRDLNRSTENTQL